MYRNMAGSVKLIIQISFMLHYSNGNLYFLGLKLNRLGSMNFSRGHTDVCITLMLYIIHILQLGTFIKIDCT